MTPHYSDRYEYQGNTMIQRIRIRDGAAVRRDWIIFDTVTAANDYFNRCCGFRLEETSWSNS